VQPSWPGFSSCKALRRNDARRCQDAGENSYSGVRAAAAHSTATYTGYCSPSSSQTGCAGGVSSLHQQISAHQVQDAGPEIIRSIALNATFPATKATIASRTDLPVKNMYWLKMTSYTTLEYKCSECIYAYCLPGKRYVHLESKPTQTQRVSILTGATHLSGAPLHW
jgi:hypothetical protein